VKILYIKLINFIGIKAAMDLEEFELKFENIYKNIIQIYGPNKSGKTVILRELHPFSSVDLIDCSRNDLSLIIKGKVGSKHIIYEVNDKVYEITHTFRPSGETHQVSSSLICDGVELNESQKVTVFNNIIERIFGINKYIFQFVINGTDLNPFGSMNSTQRKTLMNKAMGINMYDQIHRLATDDYRYTSKLITSLNNTKEYLLSIYGSYETLIKMLDDKRQEYQKLDNESQRQKSELDSLRGKIFVLNQSDIVTELNEINTQITTYNNVVGIMGNDMRVHDELVNEQIKLNEMISRFRNDQNLINKDIDNLFDRKARLQSDLNQQQQIVSDYENMKKLVKELKEKIRSIDIHQQVSCSVDYLKSIISMAQTVNSTCKEIIVCLNKNHLELFYGLLKRNIDISAFLLQEGSVLMDGEKEKSVISRVRSMINNVEGIEPIDCNNTTCLYRNSYKYLNEYFKSYQSTTEHEFTVYDIEQMDHAYKNIQVIRRLINIELPNEVKKNFNILKIMENLIHGQTGIDMSHLETLLNEAVKLELRNSYYQQLTGIENQLKTMDTIIPMTNSQEVIDEIDTQVQEFRNKLSEIEVELNQYLQALESNDKKRMLLSQIKHLNIKDLMKQQKRLQRDSDQLTIYLSQATLLDGEYQKTQQFLYAVTTELKTIEEAFAQYTNTVAEIEKYLNQDMTTKIIAEATSSTKGKPIIEIREKIMGALHMTNRLLDIMWDGEVEILLPTIDASQFSIPFRTGENSSEDIRYGSQSEKTLIFAALNLSIAALLTPYNIPLLDEIDAFLDANKRDSFIEMLIDVMTTLKIEQLFLISHNTQPGQYDHLIHTINISK